MRRLSETENRKKIVWQLGIPAMLAQLFNILYSIVDRIYIGHMSSGAALMSISMGEKNHEAAQRSMNNSLLNIVLDPVFIYILHMGVAGAAVATVISQFGVLLYVLIVLKFLPFGSDTEETPDVGEVVYAVGQQVRTRRWTWRQSEHGKITADSSDIFFPIDGFTDFNRENVIKAQTELDSLLKNIFQCETKIGFIDSNNREMEL